MIRSSGLEDVDRVLADVDGLADRPLGDHVAVYADAHDRLRSALDPADPDFA